METLTLPLDAPPTESTLDGDLAALLTDLAAAQSELLETLREKRLVLMRADAAGLDEITLREAALIERLQNCQRRRAQLLAQAADEGKPAANLRALAKTLDSPQHRQLAPDVNAAASQARLLQHEALTNWVVAQQTLVHLSQLLEIIATGGRLQPTYPRADAAASGALLDQLG
jgi:flagellar FlgN protein